MQIQNSSQGQIPIQVPLVKLVAKHRLHTFQLGSGDHLPDQYPFGQKTDAGLGRSHVVAGRASFANAYAAPAPGAGGAR